MTNAGLIAHAQKLEPLLNAFVAFSTSTAKPGKLKRSPYVAKDIFAAPDRRPCGGLAHPLPPMDCRYADVLRALDAAGAARIGYTGLTEIAYEPSGYNAVHGRVRNPWNPDFISGG
jgi:Asp-tRNA(Asn)/Glu-tRNA(Gln) amidotransferase A subunit family amidase